MKAVRKLDERKMEMYLVSVIRLSTEGKPISFFHFHN